MIEDIIAEPVCRNGVVYIVPFVGIPVLRQLLGAEDKDRTVSVFIIFDDSKCGKCLSKSNTVCKDAAIILFQLVDDGKHRIFLEVVKHPPDPAVLKACCLIRKHILRYVIQKLIENIIQCVKIYEVRGILPVGCRNALCHNIGDIQHLLFVIPNLFKQVQVVPSIFKTLCLLYWIISIVAPLTAQIHSRKAIDWHIGTLIHSQIAHHLLIGNIRLKPRLVANPFCTFLCNRSLCHLVAEFYFKFRTIETSFPIQFRDIELSPLPLCFLLHKSRRSKDETEIFNIGKLFLQLFIGIDGETGRRYRNPASLLHICFQIIPNSRVHIVENLHDLLLPLADHLSFKRYLCHS